jgi:twitching motility protein PilT
VTGNLSGLLKAVHDLGGSDLHLAVGSPPRVRVDGALRSMDLPALTPDTVRTLIHSVLTGPQRAKLEEAWEIDVAFPLCGVGRVRSNVFHQRGAIGAVYRLIPDRPLALEDLGLPAVVAELADRPRGLVLITGATGSGKSTTLAAMVDRINRTRPSHVLTMEDPIEHLHEHQMSLINQRELHTDMRSLAQGLRSALREDPDVVLVGEMRDRETMEAALTLAETGHLTMASLHTNSAAQTITRVVDAFPAHQQSQIRTQLSLTLEGIVCQALVPRASGHGRVAALEIMVATTAIRTLIRDDKIHQLYGAMQAGQERVGMQTMNQSLARLVERRAISREAARTTSSSRDELDAMLDRRCGRAPAASPRPLRPSPAVP